MADAIRDVVIRLNLETGEGKIKPPDTSAITDALKKEIELRKESERLAESATRAAIEGEEKAAEATKLANDQLILQAKLLDDARESTLRLQDATKQMIGAVRKIGDGMMALTRAVALLGAAGSEELQQLIKTLVVIQGLMDAWRGFADITEGVIDGFAAFSKTQKAIAEAEALATVASVTHTSALVAEATWMGTVTAAATALWASLWPVLAVMAAIAAVAALVIAAYQWWTKETREAEEAAAELKETQAAHVEQMDRNSAATIRIIGIREREQKQIRDLMTDEEKLLDLKDQGLKQQLELLDARQDQQIASGRPEVRVLEEIEAKRESIMEKIREQISLEEQANKETDEGFKKQEEELKLAKEQLEVSREALQADKDRTSSIAERFGAMSALEQAELRQLEAAKQAGTLSKEQAKRFIELDSELAGEGATDVLGQAGAAAGIEGFSVVKKQRASQAADAAAIGEESGAIAESEKDLTDAVVKSNITMSKHMDDQNKLMEASIKKTADLAVKLERIELAQAGRPQ